MMGNAEERAAELFQEGYNCAQAVLAAFDDINGMDRETALRLSAPFGGGMAQLREVCGAVSGMFMAVGLQDGFDDPAQAQKRQALYQKLQDMAGRFEQESGSLICRDLLGMAPDPQNHRPYCVNLVRCAARIAQEELAQNPPA